MVHDDAAVGLDGVEVLFDDERLGSDAGIALVATLAGRLGIERLVGQFVRLRRDRPGAANAGRKVMALIFAMLLGADSIDDCELLRAGRRPKPTGWGFGTEGLSQTAYDLRRIGAWIRPGFRPGGPGNSGGSCRSSPSSASQTCHPGRREVRGRGGSDGRALPRRHCRCEAGRGEARRGQGATQRRRLSASAER
jgi:hypothetical protein